MIPPILTGALALAWAPAAAQTLLVTEDSRVLASDGMANDLFGWPIAVDGDWAVVGALSNDAGGLDAGAAYVLRRSGLSWTEEVKLVASDASAFDAFGFGSISGAIILIGAPGNDGLGFASGAAYVFDRVGSTWTQVATLHASDASQSDCFGAGVALEGGRAVIGATDDDDADPTNTIAESGSAYVFEKVAGAWVETAKLVPQDTAVGDFFGQPIALDGIFLAVAAAFKTIGSNIEQGAVYVFREIGGAWVEEARLTAPDGQAQDYFGRGLALNGSDLIVGAPTHDALGHNVGAVYCYRRRGTDWILGPKLLPETPNISMQFGGHVAVHGDTLVVGAAGDNAHAFESGAAFVYAREGTGWRLHARLESSDVGLQDQFGWDVAVEGESILVAARRNDNPNGVDAGAVYVFRNPAPVTYCTAKTSSLGCVPYVTTSGVPSASSSEAFLLAARQVLPGEPGILLYGAARTNQNFHGGKLCIKPPFKRPFPPKAASAGGAPPCAGILKRDFNVHLRSGSDPQLTAGHFVFAQWLQRDPSDPTGFGDGLTDAVRFALGP